MHIIVNMSTINMCVALFVCICKHNCTKFNRRTGGTGTLVISKHNYLFSQKIIVELWKLHNSHWEPNRYIASLWKVFSLYAFLGCTSRSLNLSQLSISSIQCNQRDRLSLMESNEGASPHFSATGLPTN